MGPYRSLFHCVSAGMDRCKCQSFQFSYFHLLAHFPAAFQQCERHAGAHKASHGPQRVRRGPGDGHPTSGDELPLQLRAAAHHYSRTVRILISAAPSTSPHRSGSHSSAA